MVLDQVIQGFLANLIGILPRLVSATIFLALAYISIKLILKLSERALGKGLPERQKPLASFGTLLISVFLWFGTILVVLKILGMGDIAASLGTATGFLALGVALAVKGMIADAVAGYYLIKDDDFQEGFDVKTADTEGTVKEVGLRKTRIDTENGLTVVGNSEVEKKWILKD